MWSTRLIWDDDDSVTIEISPRKLLRNLGMDADSRCSVAKHLLDLSASVVDRELWDLEDSTMGIANQDYLLAVMVAGGINLVILQGTEGENDVSLLPRQ